MKTEKEKRAEKAGFLITAVLYWACAVWGLVYKNTIAFYIFAGLQVLGAFLGTLVTILYYIYGKPHKSDSAGNFLYQLLSGIVAVLLARYTNHEWLENIIVYNILTYSLWQLCSRVVSDNSRKSSLIEGATSKSAVTNSVNVPAAPPSRGILEDLNK